MGIDKDRVEGAAKKKVGEVKEAAGKALGDEKMKREGQADKASGSVQNAVGGVKDALRDKSSTRKEH
jgi:uncharacterized protein YjbJ (UPF0337 family)